MQYNFVGLVCFTIPFKEEYNSKIMLSQKNQSFYQGHIKILIFIVLNKYNIYLEVYLFGVRHVSNIFVNLVKF